jgi:hypothetical protein
VPGDSEPPAIAATTVRSPATSGPIAFGDIEDARDREAKPAARYCAVPTVPPPTSRRSTPRTERAAMFEYGTEPLRKEQ